MSQFEKVIIGNATLYRGDCIELLKAGSFDNIDALISDPPYGIGYVHAGGGNRLGRTNTKPIYGDDKPFDPSIWFEYFDFMSNNNKAILLFGADHYKTRLPEGGRFLCWDKSCGQGAATQFCDAEFMWTNRKNARSIVRHLWMGVIRSGQDSTKAGIINKHHPSQKPVEVMAWCIEHCRIGLGNIVLDPYMGVGSTGVACMQTGRKFIGCEIDKEYFDAAVKRYKTYKSQTVLNFDNI